MSRSSKDGFEAVLKRVDVTLEDWLRRVKRQEKQAETAVRRAAFEALVHGAGALRRQVDDLQVGLKKLSAGLEDLEGNRKGSAPQAAVVRVRRRAPSTTRKTSRPRSQKKAA